MRKPRVLALIVLEVATMENLAEMEVLSELPIKKSRFQSYVFDHLQKMEKSNLVDSKESCIRELRKLGLGDFGSVLWNMPDADFPKISALLPPMTSDEITQMWTGAVGDVLLDQALSFVRACSAKYAEITGGSLADKKILDFGCGYGRYLRLFQYYTSSVFGVDAWETSLEYSAQAGFRDVIKKVDVVAETIPFDFQFDFLFAFSIFTHLSEESTVAALKALRKAARPGAVLIITIRPVEFWQVCADGRSHVLLSDQEVAGLVDAHTSAGFAYYPYVMDGAADGEANYGDTSFTLEWLLANVDGWEFCGFDRSINDPLQRYIAFKAV
jgi:SAM-dependent methyltransferase